MPARWLAVKLLSRQQFDGSASPLPAVRWQKGEAAASTVQRMRRLGNAANVADKPMALASDQIYKLGAETLGWDDSTAEGVAVIAEDLKLLKRLQMANIAAGSTYLDKPSIKFGQKPVVQGPAGPNSRGCRYCNN